MKITCRVCKEELPSTEFAKNKSSKTGRASICKACYNKKYNDKKVKKRYVRGHKDIPDDNFAKPKYSMDQLIDHIEHIKQREANRSSGFNYDFLYKFEKKKKKPSESLEENK